MTLNADSVAISADKVCGRTDALKPRTICQAVWRPAEPWPYCMCQQRSLPGEDYCAKHMPDPGSADQVPPDWCEACGLGDHDSCDGTTWGPGTTQCLCTDGSHD